MGVNRIKNIDEIVTQSGTVVDLNNIQASGSGGTVSASGLAISRTEDSQYIDYAFNEGSTNTHEADGHSSSADAVMFGGTDNTLKKFSDSTIKESYGTAKDSTFSTSNGAIALIAGGGDKNQDVHSKSFASSSTSSTFGTLITGRYQGADGSDGTISMLAGGTVSGGNTDTIERMSFASAAISSNGTLRGQYNHHRGGSNGTYLMTVGGWGSSGSNASDLIAFESNTVAAEHGTITTARMQMAVCSNTDQLMLAAGYMPANTGATEMKLFSDKSVCEGWNTIESKHALSAGGNGEIAMFAGGDNGATVASCHTKSFADKSIYVTFGVINQATSHSWGCSGQAA